jgi:arylformamidase
MIYDISPAIGASTPVWPGDLPLSRQLLSDLDAGDATTSSALRATAHLGAHADAPSHVARSAPTIDERSLDLYLGRCQLIRLQAQHGERVLPEDLPCSVNATRLLLGTNTYGNATSFRQDFAALSVELVDFVHQRGVRLVGIDTPSVDLFADQSLPVHRRLAAHDTAILEGLVLDHVPPGIYELIALPLKLVGFDASPVRAVLRTL